MQKIKATGLLLSAALVISWPFRATAQSEVPSLPAVSAPVSARSFDEFVAAVHLRESDGRVGPIYGDGGRSFGPLQISYKAWVDSVKFDTSIGGSYRDCQSLDYSKKIMMAYLRKHDPGALSRGDWEACARLWNSGPEWRAKTRHTNTYWAAVRNYLNRAG